MKFIYHFKTVIYFTLYFKKKILQLEENNISLDNTEEFLIVK